MQAMLLVGLCCELRVSAGSSGASSVITVFGDGKVEATRVVANVRDKFR